MRISMKGSVAVAVLAIAFSADAFLPDTMQPVFAGQAFAASANGRGNGKAGENGNCGRSADAGSGGASSSEGSTSGQGGGGGLLRLLATGSARPSSTGGGAPVATGGPVQLLSSHAAAGTGSPVTTYVKEIVAITGQPPGEIHRMLGGGHGYFNSDEQAKLHAAYDSRIKRVERYLQANAVLEAALAANGGVLLEDQEYGDALAYLGAVEIVNAPAGTYTAEEIAAADAIIAGSTLDAATAQAIVDAYEAFEEADNQPYDEDRRALYDDLAFYLGLP